MTRSLVVTLLLACAVSVAHAAPHAVLVLRAEGTADASTRATVDTHVLRLAKGIDGKVDPGDITLSDAGAAAGCNPVDSSCKDEILMTFGVDEIVTTMVLAGSNGAFNVTVRRIQKGKQPKVAWSQLQSGKDPAQQLNKDIGPMFGTGLSTGPLTERPGGTNVTTTPPTTNAATKPEPPASARTVEPPLPADSGTEPMSNNTTDPAPSTTMTPTPTAEGNGVGPNRRLQKIGMGVGAGMVVLSFVLWSQAAGLQDDIDTAPADTPADFMRLQQLESDADGLAGGGNLFFLAGLVVGGVSGYYYWKKGRDYRASTTTTVTPTVMPGGGAGLVLTIGGAR